MRSQFKYCTAYYQCSAACCLKHGLVWVGRTTPVGAALHTVGRAEVLKPAEPVISAVGMAGVVQLMCQGNQMDCSARGMHTRAFKVPHPPKQLACRTGSCASACSGRLAVQKCNAPRLAALHFLLMA